MQTVGITGASGIMGQVLMKNNPDINWVSFEGDLLNPGDLKNWFEGLGHKTEKFIHLAAIVPTHLVDQDPIKAMRVNVEGTCLFLEQVRQHNPQAWIFLASTAHVYASSETPLREESKLEPISWYGLTKLHAEQWASALSGRYEMPLCIGRIFSCSSPLHPKTYFLPAMVEKISKAPRGGKLEIRGLKGTRDFQTAEQACAAIRFLMDRKAQGVFNVASGVPVKLHDLVLEIQKRLGREDVKIVPLDTETSHLTADVSKLKELGFQPRFDLGELLN